jgi:hypothetical protein
MSRRSRRAVHVILLAAVLQLFAGVAGAAQVIVCRGLDGHVEIESGFGDDCCPSDALATRATVRTDQGCDGCVDTPATGAGASVPAKSDVGIGSLPAPWRLAPVASGGLAEPRALSAPPGSFGLRRSVVLLI